MESLNMTEVRIAFAKIDSTQNKEIAVLIENPETLNGEAARLDKETSSQIYKAIKSKKFKGKAGDLIELVSPYGLDADRLVLLGGGELKDTEALGEEGRYLHIGGTLGGKLNTSCETLSVIIDENIDPKNIADIALGLVLRAYEFDRYKSKPEKEDEDEKDAFDTIKVTFHLNDPKAAEKEWKESQAVANGVMLARDLVNEPANALGPEEFAQKAKDLEALGVKVTILDEKDMRKHKMFALLGVGQGSERPSRLAIMEWQGNKKQQKPFAIVGKGVVFDTGGISIKPSSGMEDMKGDMGGAACVVGLMHTLAERKAKVHAIGVIGCVENMPDGKAQRPGDIVTAMNGKTIEIINTDAEGRLVLADALHYTITNYEPEGVIDLATLTGAIIVALGHQYAGLFSNNDELAEGLNKAGSATGDRVWRMPLGKAYDKLIDSDFADMKNTGGRWAGSTTAAQFLQRFVGETPWAHIDIAGTAMSSPKSAISASWGSGFGVRLLDRYLKDRYET
jgi:leucyl aminopeptidase